MSNNINNNMPGNVSSESLNKNGLGSLDYANLTQEEISMLQQIEGKINNQRNDKVVLMALTKHDMK